jgi:glycosyltransferase involved in cell wall biosynthesis
VDDAPALAGVLTAVLDDPDLAASLREAALATARRFTWARSAAEHRAIYSSIR